MRRLLLPLLATILLALAPAATVPVGALPAPFAHLGAQIASADTVTTLSMPAGTYPAGTYQTAQQTVAADTYVSLSGSATFTAVPSGTDIVFEVLASYDGGATWVVRSIQELDGGTNAKTHQLDTVNLNIAVDVDGPALWYARFSCRKAVTLASDSVTIDTSPGQ